MSSESSGYCGNPGSVNSFAAIFNTTSWKLSSSYGSFLLIISYNSTPNDHTCQDVNLLINNLHITSDLVEYTLCTIDSGLIHLTEMQVNRTINVAFRTWTSVALCGSGTARFSQMSAQSKISDLKDDKS
jgi:hypothetical protein